MMPRLPRKEFSHDQRALIYKRDRATCCFSGANLWLLDAPLRPGYQWDWVDHVKPLARSGKSVVENGVCASHFYNAKKRHNGADNRYLFRNGLPTADYFYVFGRLPAAQARRLSRLANLHPADWHFNRALCHALAGFDYRCWKEWEGWLPQRDDRYWFRSAYRRLCHYQDLDPMPLEARQVVDAPADPIARQWLALRQCDSEQRFLALLEDLFAAYRTNAGIWADYFYYAESDEDRMEAIKAAESCPHLGGDVLACIQSDYGLRTSSANFKA